MINGGTGNYVNAEAQDGSLTTPMSLNNANFFYSNRWE
jgi:hypothetical protein